MVRVVILGSGRGSNAEAVLRAQEIGKLGLARVVGLISDRPDAPILDLGRRFDVFATYLSPGSYKTKLVGADELHYIDMIRHLAADLVVLAGFMRVIKPAFIKAFPQRIINLHPSLLPAFPGLNAIKQAFEAKVAVTGCTVHYVNEEVDAGKIIQQAQVAIDAEDTLSSLEAKVHAAEHELLPRVIKELAKVIAVEKAQKRMKNHAAD